MNLLIFLVIFDKNLKDSIPLRIESNNGGVIPMHIYNTSEQFV